MTRDLGAITDAMLLANEIDFSSFAKIVLPAPFGTRRYTDRAGGFTGDVDGSSQTWEETDLTIGPIFQSRQDILRVNWIKFGNGDNAWTNWAFSPGLRNGLVTVYKGWWNTTTLAHSDDYIEYEGKIDDVEINSMYVQMALRPHHVPWNTKITPERMSGKCVNIYRNLEDCQYTGAEPGAETTCAKTRTACAARSNTLNINIYDDAPRFNEELIWGGIKHGLRTFEGNP